MMVSNKSSFLRVVFIWQWKHSLVFLLCGLIAYLLHDWHLVPVKTPSSPAAIIGAALGIFASFRANAAYQRWWEGRQLWGKLVNASRLLSTQTTTYLKDAARQRRVILRHALYVHVLRTQLRDDDPFADDHVKRLLPLLGVDDDDTIAGWKKQASLGLALVDQGLKDAAAEPGLDARQLQSLDASFAQMLDVQGGTERIKRTPMPRSYGFFVERLIFMFAFVFPFTIVEEMGWLVIPVNVLVAMGFTLISETGRVLEDPFTWFWNSLPLTQMSVNIERNIRQRLHGAASPASDGDLPAPVVVDAQGILW